MDEARGDREASPTPASRFWQWLVADAYDPAEARRRIGRRLAEAEAEWHGPGEACVTDRHLALTASGTRRQSSLSTVEEVVCDGDAVWVRRRQAHDGLVQCATDAEAARLAEAIVAGRNAAR